MNGVETINDDINLYLELSAKSYTYPAAAACLAHSKCSVRTLLFFDSSSMLLMHLQKRREEFTRNLGFSIVQTVFWYFGGLGWK